MSLVELYMIIGFALAGYAIIANDSIQTLGTFIASNSHRPWWILWLFSSSVLVVVVIYGWLSHGGDPAYERLEKFPEPENGLSLYHLIPPLAILLLTRMGIPVSTTFLVLAVFNPKNIDAMLIKSGLGYLIAFGVAIVIYRFVINKLTEYFNDTQGQPVATYWVVLQWCATAFLWSQWLVQDLANIFVYVPRDLSIDWLVFCILFLVLLQGIVFFYMGGRIQKIVTMKTGTSDIRAATIIDILYALILLVFKEWSNMPMSTTWVFLGFLAGRQFAISLHLFAPPLKDTSRIVALDAVKAFSGLVVSITLALGLPFLF